LLRPQFILVLHDLAAAFALALTILLMAVVVSPASAQDATSRLGADYDIFSIGGSDPKLCAAACAEDPRCKAWSFIKTIGQCRLKHTAVAPVANACCASGVKTVAPRPARPEEIACADYAVEALDQNNANITNQCGYRGPTWPVSFSDAYSRCLDASPRLRKAERDDRAQSIEECRTVVARSDELACDHYARLSVEEMKTNQQNRCRLRGPLWSDRASDHVTYCQGVTRAVLADATVQREDAIRQCLGRTGVGTDDSERACAVYVDKSLSQVVQAQQLRCGRAFSGPTWTPDQAQHFAFCQARPAKERDALLRQRADALVKCEQDRKRFRFILKF
jgi:PAN domain